ncbi:hypothetical protein AAFF_G00422120, partial [Aldrovandia affinis]
APPAWSPSCGRWERGARPRWRRALARSAPCRPTSPSWARTPGSGATPPGPRCTPSQGQLALIRDGQTSAKALQQETPLGRKGEVLEEAAGSVDPPEPWSEVHRDTVPVDLSLTPMSFRDVVQF